MNLPRMIISALAAVGVTLGLFIFMYKLVFSQTGELSDVDELPGIHFGPVEIPNELQTKQRRKPQKPPPPKNPPPPPKMQVQKAVQNVTNLPQLDIPNLDVPLVGGSGLFLGNFATVDRTAEGDIIPLVRIQPQYPRQAAIAKLEGWVKIEFTITAVGTVKEPRVVEAEPSRVFDREAVRAILKWKFKPRVVDGVAVDRRATQIIEFTLDPES